MKSLLIALLISANAHALVLISESRSVFVDYWENSIERSETLTSVNQFGEFNAAVNGIPFGGGFASAYQFSNITTDGFDLRHGTVDYYGPGAVARSDFSFTFALLEPARITITGVSSFFRGVASFDGGGGLVWVNPPGTTFPYFNMVNYDQIIGVGTYTFTSAEHMRYDDANTRFTFRAQGVPDGGMTAFFFAAALSTVGIFRRLVSEFSAD